MEFLEVKQESSRLFLGIFVAGPNPLTTIAPFIQESVATCMLLFSKFKPFNSRDSKIFWPFFQSLEEKTRERTENI